eukprot:GHVS01018438.1.p1 GENE.GHVS01018438.1~~GHVS01018438.1.p1  ORF type:complete len:291 (-),score=76.80 GHVS01018438.1:591-1463(-)
MAAIPSSSPLVGPSPIPSNADPRGVSGRLSQQQHNTSTTRQAYTPAGNMLPTVSQIQPAVTQQPTTSLGLQSPPEVVSAFVMPTTAATSQHQGSAPTSGGDENMASAVMATAAGTNNAMMGSNFAGQPTVSMERMQQQQMQMAPILQQNDMNAAGGILMNIRRTATQQQHVTEGQQSSAAVGAGGVSLAPFGGRGEQQLRQQQFGSESGPHGGLLFPSCGGMMPSTNMSIMPALNGKPLMYFNPRQSGYDDASCGQDPRQGYPLVYPYVPIRDNNDRKDKTSKKKRTGCC